MTTPSTLVSDSHIRTRFLIFSDTHGMKFSPENYPHHPVDVAIHCGDLTEESKIAEFRISLNLLKSLNASLKLVIAGNHDFTLDIPTFKRKVAEAEPSLEPDLVAKEYGTFGEVRGLFKEEEAKNAGIVFLDEGTHRFVLKNGATLTVYASPYTPSLGDWGFQYHPEKGHTFSIQDGTDIVITHGPPKGIMDLTHSRERAGCPDLFAAVARACPRLHCFGHIHEGWGAKLVTWREKISEIPSHFADIDNDKSVVIETLRGFRYSKVDEDKTEAASEKQNKTRLCTEGICRYTSHCIGDHNQLLGGSQTLFVNAATQGDEEYPVQLPWLVNIELPKATIDDYDRDLARSVTVSSMGKITKEST
ncbi:Metallo-dependent phosphatase-like protein [Annulohypoxylon maeteangense]|uniref:Metallo-dependent phosphatase-like protein n=1 Tax=Annulohypoxylon maeteangense TaxID=1927788 RepID=UPI0020080CF4|nr:Metallo-dependent phosphatase-like protein [Annulohypoxylon maeteangense]KAI0879908.1 Metallo-dependent phosphatase-like protein [Annulohypoxylon maeteangense]